MRRCGSRPFLGDAMSFETIRIKLINAQQGRTAIIDVCERIKPWLVAGHPLSLEVKAETRSTEQNRLLWSCLRDLSQQVEWYGEKLTDEEWKDFLTAALRKERVVPGMNGGFVVLGQRTSKMTKAEMTELIDLAHAFGDDKSVNWSPTSLGREWAAAMEAA